MGFLAQNNVNVLPWPTHSPDVVPIEHVWDEIVRRIAAGGAPLMLELEQRLFRNGPICSGALPHSLQFHETTLHSLYQCPRAQYTARQKHMGADIFVTIAEKKTKKYFWYGTWAEHVVQRVHTFSCVMYKGTVFLLLTVLSKLCGGCVNGGYPKQNGEGQNLKCVPGMSQCGIGYLCEIDKCCPVPIQTGGCVNGGYPKQNGEGQNLKCVPGMSQCGIGYLCEIDKCCPVPIQTGPCPNGGMPAQIDGTDKQCDRDVDCGGSYQCTNNYCCPVTIQSGMCPFDGIPQMTEMGEPRMCNKTSKCMSELYGCEGVYCCPRRFSTDGICPGDASPEFMDGVVRTCPNNNRCGGGYSCQFGHCCPFRVFTGVCANGGNAMMEDGKMVMCSEEKPCDQSGYTYYCPNGGTPAYYDGRPGTCHSNKSCDDVMYTCDGGYCCPSSVVFDGPCPSGGMAAQIDGTAIQCDRDVDCGGSYQCTNNYCCPVTVQSGKCPFDGIPQMTEMGEPRMCNMTSQCMSESYGCEGGFCCPQRFSTEGICPGDASPEIMDGAVRTCPNNNRCGGGYSCQFGHCCPVRVFTGVCANGGNVSMEDGKMVMCSPEKPCNQSGYTCNRAGYCCPAKVYKGYCPNGGKPAYHDDRPKTCHDNKSCDGGMYHCDGGYCCPQSVAFSGPCPNGGMAAQIDGTDKQCDRDVDCGGSYQCTNNYCCPVTIQSGMCPFDGIPQMTEMGEPRMCNKTSKCMSKSYGCEGVYCCPRRFSTDGICPGDASPEIMDGAVRTCPNNNRCGGGYSCQFGHCCPVRVFTGVCANGGNVSMEDGKMVMCSPEKPCNQSGYTCNRAGYCCPAKVYKGYCPNGGKPAYHDDRPKTCHDNKSCDGGMYHCDGGYCCPQSVAFSGPCPNGGMAAQIDGTDKQCDRDVDCGGSYQCTNNYCCPVTIQSGMCPFDGIPQMTEMGEPRMCNKTSKCMSKSYGCEGVYCCPRRFSTDGICPGDASPEIMDGAVRTCPNNNRCGGGYSCQFGHCCPVRVFTGVCANGGNVSMEDGKMVMCSEEKPCDQSGYTCNRAGYCCPAKVYKGYCPNGGKPAYHDDRPKTCHDNKSCDGGMYHCDGGYCCPQSVAFSGPCPNGGMAAQIDGTDKQCDRDVDCGGSYQCTNNYCCPVTIQSGMCPFDGIPQMTEMGEPRMCNKTSKCMSKSYGCEGVYCCPRRFSTDGICPGDASPEIMDGAVRTCPNNKRCGGGYSCQFGHCCPVRVFTGVCANGGNVSMEDGKMVMCSPEKPCNQSGYTCNRAGYCCPAKVYKGYCPNGGKPAYHDGRPATCHANKSCDGGMYHCDGGYCCPPRVAFSGPCPNGGMAARIDGTDKQCDRDVDCGGSYQCTNNYCCPVTVQSGMCPFDGIPKMTEMGEPRMCNRTSQCMSKSYGCEEVFCCPRRFSTDGICPGDASPEIMDGVVRTCPNNKRCGGGYSCQFGHCCPVRVFTGVCANGGNVSMEDGEMVMCSPEKPCNQSGYTCNRAGYCCPAKVYKGYCPNGGKPAYHDGRPATCHDNKSCDGGMYHCDGGYCCPQSVVFSGPCPNGGMAAQIDGTDKQCDRDVDCGGSYQCTNNYCCPVTIQSGMCPFDGIPQMTEMGEPRMCNRTSKCMSKSYGCEGVYCCPRRFSTDGICQGDAVPELMDNVVRKCPNNTRCGAGYTCHFDHCCPARVFTGVCANGGNVSMEDGKMVMCSPEKPCNQSGYTCNRAGYCCPAKVYKGYCPNGGKPAYHDRRPQTCHDNKSCDGGMYHCDGGYCCPQKIAFSGFCPYGGIAEKTDNKDRECTNNVTSKCGLTYSCTNSICCPGIFNDRMSYCPFGGLVEMKNGQPRTCNESQTGLQCRARSHSCLDGYCCPNKVILEGYCPGRSIPEMIGDVPKRCEETNDTNICSSDSFCVNNMCCPRVIIADGPCKYGGEMKSDTLGMPVPCDMTEGSCGTTHTCEDVAGSMACCPRTVNISHIQEPCGPGPGPLLSKDGSSALLCEDNTTCPNAFSCLQMTGQSFRLCCPIRLSPVKRGQCPPLTNGTIGICLEQCSDDTECSGNRKCCSNGCGHTCQNPVSPVKRGQCPPLTNGTIGICLEQCSDDTECSGNRKCCSNGCGHTCQNPDNGYELCGKDKPLEYKNGTALYCSRGGQQCPRDSVCTIEGSDQYGVCCPTTAYKEKKMCANFRGGYPMRFRNGTYYDCSNGKDCPYNSRCMTDKNGTYAVCCSFAGGDDKPCNYFRGGEERKYPNGTSLFCGRGPHSVTCPSDTNCTIHPTDRFAVCCPKNASKPGTCPKTDEVTTEKNGDTCADVCTVDTDCDGHMKCCSRGCGLTCQKPVKRKPKTDCQKRQMKVAMSLLTEGDVCASVFIPRCDRNGNYSRTQCQDNTGVCWCVYSNGTEIPNTRRIGRPQCGKATRPGQCPVMTEVGENDPTPSCSIQCSSDDDCLAGHRCCEHAVCGPMCQPIRENPEPEMCPAGVKAMCCDFLQCVDHMCPAHPWAKCRMNPCGGCRVEFYDKYSNKVNCTEGMTPCQLQRMNAHMRKSNATRKERIWKYIYMIKQEEEGVKREEKETTKSEDTIPKIEETDKMDEVCSLPMEKGPCKAYIYRYYYNHTQGLCMKFKYGGCNGNKNNFEDSDTCYKTCSPYKAVPPFCVPKPQVGPCEALIPKYFYNVTAEKCEMFYWGGCGKDLTNNFDSKDICMKKCAPFDVCHRRNCGPEYTCKPTGYNEADCIPKNQVQSVFQPYVPRCEKDGSFSPQQCIGDTCWCVDSLGRPDNNTISMGYANCTGSDTGGQAPSKTPITCFIVVCPDNTRPMVCEDKCQKMTCGGRSDVQCLINPCQGCQVKFVDQDNNEVSCDVDPCDMNEPQMIAKPAGGCVNGARRWFFKKSTQTCEIFKYAKNCYGKDTYFKSLLDCQNKCRGSPCGETGVVRTCTNDCANMTCQFHPDATCKVNPCNCDAHFYDPVTLEPVNCSQLTTQCQKNRTKAFMMYSERAAAGTADTNIILPQCREDGYFSNQQCNETSLICWCVNGAGQEVAGTKVRVSSTNLDIGCSDNNVTEALVSLIFNYDFNLVRGKKAAFKGVIRTLREGSIVADLTVNGEADPTAVATEIEENVKTGSLQVVFEGNILTADPSSVRTDFVFQAQTGDKNDIPIVRRDGGDNTAVIALIITIVVLAAILIIVALFILRKRSQEKNDFSSLEDSGNRGHTNAVYNQVYEKT
ncbi:fibrillin-2-like [Ylistrum balloti]|uniref:fibrillin-2-like n=1 Tax=Ylistrum balloti TaxID=509963 RepID=UPI002905CECD|nr:fibrillin-2-like [Ylistrum balloti]